MHRLTNAGFVRILFLPLLVILIFSLLFKQSINGLLYGFVSSLIPGINGLAKSVSWQSDATAIWTVFWLTPPLMIPIVIFLAINHPAPRRTALSLILIFFAMLALTTLYIFWLWKGPAGNGGGRIWSIYQGSYIGFLSVSFCSWVGAYSAIYGCFKSLLMALDIGAFKEE